MLGEATDLIQRNAKFLCNSITKIPTKNLIILLTGRNRTRLQRRWFRITRTSTRLTAAGDGR